MTARTLFCAAALAAGIATSVVAQSNVYSLDVVGYYNVPVTSNLDFTSSLKLMVGNQLHTTTDTLATVIPNPPPLSQFFKFNGGFRAYTFDDVDLVWLPDGNVSLAPGEGGFFISPVNTTLTFVGEVPQGSLTNTLPINGKVIRTSMVPQAGRISTDLGLPAEPFDQLFQFSGFQYRPGYTAFEFDDVDLVWLPNEPQLSVGEAFFYIKAGGNTQSNWIRNFTVQ